ncbi:DNA repair protein RecO [Qingshengfaniella alkalisoli]|uniref:DNA repair protein RecO n=1 Tax=Qingshengfaniella alkalisoli TaxID=2599296 RepID=A0A5B8J125_9RHOB|nr:DNA repair protein RecO [Qingshengfaniella alkalisoli]QDY68197.1 DNA repair protein RecO [Qingshengfaniella alkalisoli]
MEWRDQGALLAVRRHGESSAIVEIFAQDHGRYAGVVRGGTSRKIAPILQPGAQLDVTWRARLDEHIGHFTVEPVRSRAAGVMTDRLALAGLNALCGLLAYALPERASYPDLYRKSVTLLDLLSLTDSWPLAYLQWEMLLLDQMGFGLNLSRCAVTGRTDGLVYVSPRTGRAVSAEGAGDWADRLLSLPPCLLGQGDASNHEIALALRTTGYFLERNLPPRWENQPFPMARQRLVDLLARYSDAGTNSI